jgi:amino acid transporter
MVTEAANTNGATLARTLGLGGLVAYGVGDMLGSGIYALIGKAAGVMGNAVWLAFLASMVAAALTALSYASLGSRYPRAAGAAYVTQRAFRRPWLSYVVGLAVLASGLTSMAAQSRAFSGYFAALVPGLPPVVIVVGFLILLTAVNFWGIRESTGLNLVCTAVEFSGLLVVIVVGLRFWGRVNYVETPSPDQVLALPLVLTGGVLTFFSFVGFEDMINVIEEVREPRRVFPRGILLAMICVTLIYLAVSISAVSVVPHGELAASGQPLVDVVRRAAPRFPPAVFALVSLFAITNTALLNCIMGSRLLYGMARQRLVPAFIGQVHARRRTPHRAIGILFAIAVTLALVSNIASLARATSILLLGVFIIVHASLLVLRRRGGEPRGFEVPVAVPLAGIVVCGALLAHAKWAELLTAGLLIGVILALYLGMRPRNVTEESLAELVE